MSFNGISTYVSNLNRLMDSMAFKEADDAEKMRLGGRLFFSKYGIGSFYGFGPVHKLPEKEKSNVEGNGRPKWRRSRRFGRPC